MQKGKVVAWRGLKIAEKWKEAKDRGGKDIYINIYAATAAKSLQSCPSLCDPIDGSPRGSPVPGILQARTLEWVAISFSSASAPSTLSHASNLDWRFVSYMIIYMFQCLSLKSSHPHPLPQSPKDCSIHLCLFCCLAYRVIATIFSEFHIYALVYCVGVFLSGLLHSV